LEQNFRFLRNEIDIIAKKEHTIVFIEVKTRQSSTFGPPEEAVTKAKQRQIRKTAQGYIDRNHLKDPECRFDVLAISLSQNGTFSIDHLENAF
jgi:putative endonuclease